jgi:hypothetical protein
MAEWSTYDEITAALLNQKTVYIGTTAPSTPYDGQIWVDISKDPPVVKLYDTTNTQWLTYFPIIYETDTGSWSDPTFSPAQNGTLVVSYNADQGEARLYMYANDAWEYANAAASPLETTYDTLEGNQSIGLLGNYQFANNSMVCIHNDATIELQWYSDDNSAWIDCVADSNIPTLFLTAGTKNRIYNDTGDTDYINIIEATPPGGISWDQGSLADQGTILLKEGINTFYFLETQLGSIYWELNESGWKRAPLASLSISGITKISDGTNVRVNNQSGAARRYLHVYQTAAV